MNKNKKDKLEKSSILLTILIVSGFIQPTQAALPVFCYALIIDQFAGSSESPIYTTGPKFFDALVNLGWDSNLIFTMYGENEITENSLQDEINFIQVNIHISDLFFIFINVESYSFLNNTLDFEDWFPNEYLKIKSAQKVILIESSQSGSSIEKLNFVDGFGLSSVGSSEKNFRFTSEDFLNWSLSEPPFTGGISAHFWIDTISNLAADTSGNSVITMDEVESFSLERIRQIYREKFNENLTWTSEEFGITDPNATIYPTPLSYNNHPHNLTLNATEFILNNNNYVNPRSFWLPTVIVGAIAIPLVVFQLYSYGRRLRVRREKQ